MARVSRAAAVHSRGVQSHGPSLTHVEGLYPSISSLRSIQEQEEKKKLSCREWCLSGLSTIYSFTLESCECLSCFFSKPNVFKLPGDVVEDEDTQSMKEKLTFHFMNPFQKWTYSRKRRFPWKLLVQLISIFLVTLQLVLFANKKFAFTKFIEENQNTFTKLFVLDPKQPDGDDPLPSPIQTLYTHMDLEEQVNFTIIQFFDLDSVALGSYGYGWTNSQNPDLPPTIMMTIRKHNDSHIDPAAKIFYVSQNITTVSLNLTEHNSTVDWMKIRSELSQTLDFTFNFEITSIFIDPEDLTKSQCFQFSVQLLIRNDVANGNMPVDLSVTPTTSKCSQNDGDSITEGDTAITVLSSTGMTVLDSIVMVFGIISILQCARSLISSWTLSREVHSFFVMKFDYRLKFHQILPLYNMWFLGVIISNLLVLIGCILKLLVSYSVISSLMLVDYTSIIIGLAVFGQWCGLLRFLSYLDKYNMLLITLRLSIPSVIRFIICTGILYIAFLLCGWLVLGPYHPKFRDPFVTSECLFSLINGDDMFATYKGMSVASTPVYIFSKVYLYIFIGLFIYVVLSVFISLISDTYETLHEHWYERSKGLLIDFASGKLSRAHYHGNTHGHTHEHGHGHGHEHANAHVHDGGSHPDVHHVDPKEEEDYEYIREASNRFTGTTGVDRGNPLIVNGGPELHRSAASSEKGDASNSDSQRDQDEAEWTPFMHGNMEQNQFPHIQIQNFGTGPSETM